MVVWLIAVEATGPIGIGGLTHYAPRRKHDQPLCSRIIKPLAHPVPKLCLTWFATITAAWLLGAGYWGYETSQRDWAQLVDRL